MSNDNKPGGEPSAAELNQAAAAEIHTGMMAIHDVMNEVARVNQPLGLEQLKALLRLYAARRGMRSNAICRLKNGKAYRRAFWLRRPSLR